jgi:hypothetical protein
MDWAPYGLHCLRQDPLHQRSLYTLSVQPNPHLHKGPALAVEQHRHQLWGAACPRRGAKTLDKFHGSYGVNALLRCAAERSGRRRTLFMVDAAVVRSAGFDFALLGHEHAGRLWPQRPCCAYPGSPNLSREANSAHRLCC